MSNDKNGGFLSAVERAKMVAAKITGQMPSDAVPMKRSADSFGEDNSSKKFASVNDAVGAQLAMLKNQQLGGSSAEDIKVPDKLVGLLIGRGGETIHRLQAESQCKVQIAQDSNGQPDRIISLIGSRPAIDEAKRLIDEILKSKDPRSGLQHGGGGGGGDGGYRSNQGIEVCEINIPGNKCGLIIGKGGETIKRLSEQFGVKLVVIQQDNTSNVSEKPLRITGDPEKVARAKEAVLGMLNLGPGAATSTSGGGGGGGRGGGYSNDYGGKGGGGYGGSANSNAPSEAFIKVPGDKAGIVIGKGGETIKDINRRTGAHVEIDKNHRPGESGDKMFVIKGTQDQIQHAQQLIYEKITGIQGNVPNDYFGGGGNGSAAAYGNAAAQQAWYAQQWQDPKAAADPSAAWAAYYQYYGQQPAVAGTSAAVGATAGAAAAGGAAASPSVNPATGQPDYSQAWIDYYRSLGMHEQADAILKQTQQQSGSGTPQQSSNQQQQQQSSSSQQQGQQKDSNGHNNNAAAWSGGYPGYQGYAGYPTPGNA